LHTNSGVISTFKCAVIAPSKLLFVETPLKYGQLPW